MNKEFIPYTEALALKELGFNEPCLAFYHNHLHPINIGFNWLDGQCTNTALEETLCLPLWQSAFRWFREKGYLISVDSLTSTEHEFYIKWSPDKSVLSNLYNTYEEAELECLRKLIQLVKEKK